jgi:outer membrane protein TolC
MNLVLVSSAVLAGSAARAEAPSGGEETCELRRCVDLGLAHAPDLKAREAAREGAEASRKSTRGNFGPKLRVDGGVQVWDSELQTSFSSGIPGIEVPPFTVRDAVTWNFNVTLAQPLMGLWTIFEAHELAELGVDVAKLEESLGRVDTALAVTEAWLTTLLADDLVAVRKTSLAARLSDRERATALVRAGVIVEADLLRAELGVTEAKQSLGIAERQATLARARLAQLVGQNKSPVAAVGAEKAGPPALEAAKQAASDHRLELVQLRARLAQADRAVGVATSQMAPSVNLVAQAQFNGGSEFQQDSAFVGLQLEWTVWEWGATKFKIDEAKARVREVRARLAQLEEGLRLEAESRWVEHASAVDQAVLAAEAVKVAESNYALVRKRFEAKAATTFDLVEAETALTKSRTDEKMARVSALLARARLARAMGGDVEVIVEEGAP